MRIVDVATEKPYRVHIGSKLLAGCGALVRDACGGSRACVVSDSNVAPLYAKTVEESLAANGYETSLFVFSAGEQSKNAATYIALLEHLAGCTIDRHDVVIALGGGVTGDLAGFAAATYMRGCRFVQVPTSLLAMVDSSVGGKTAIDLDAGKNLAGAFRQPDIVIIDVDCLETLESETFSDGCGEMVKHAVLADESLFSFLEKRPFTLASALDDPEFAQGIIARNIEIKRDIVIGDEKESGRRKLLNLGHTVGHAVESCERYRLGHGSCVSIGMTLIAKAAAQRGWCEEGLPGRIEQVLKAHGLATATALSPSDIAAAAKHDKKRISDRIEIVVPRSIGACDIESMPMDDFEHLLDQAMRN